MEDGTPKKSMTPSGASGRSYASSRLSTIGACFASISLVTTLFFHIGSVMTLAFAFAIAGWEGGTDFVLHSQFPVVVNAIGYCGPFFGVIGGGVATMSFVRAISDWPLGGSDKIANYFALAVGVVMSLWTLARFMR